MTLPCKLVMLVTGRHDTSGMGVPGLLFRTEAQKAIEVAYVEATCNANAIGLVKLMGRSSCQWFLAV